MFLILIFGRAPGVPPGRAPLISILSNH